MDQSGRKEEREREGEKKRRSMRGDFGLAQGVRDVDILYNYKQKKKKSMKNVFLPIKYLALLLPSFQLKRLK